MAETPQDPAGTTHQFKAFATSGPPDRSGRVNPAVIAGAAVVAALVLIALVAVIMIA